MADIAYQLGIQLDIDSIASASHNVFREKARKICSTLFSLPKRALIIDDLAEILRSGTVKEVNQLTILLEEAAKPISFTGGRIFVLSSIWAPDKWFRMAGISHLPLKRLTDKYIRRVIEFHMRAAGLVSGDNPPRIPQELLNVVDGHPLSARLVVDVLRSDGEDLDALTQDLATVTGKLATELLKRVELSAHERELMIRLAVFRLPVLLGVLLEIDYSFKVSDLLGLTKRFILYHDGRALGMHEAVRRYFYSRIGSAQERQKLHRIAAAYDADRQAAKKDPSIIAELAHHLVLAGEGSRARTLKSIVIEEMKPAARKLYKEDHDYEAALDVYRLLSDVAADDAEVWAYVGRCYARLGLWEDSDGAFEKALDVASRTGVQRWWIYRDWGHIRARFEYYEFASELLVKAAQLHSEDAGISASLAYMHWREGDEEEARRLFEEALELNHYHEYTLTYYPKLLDELGEGLYAIELRKRLAAFQSEAALHSRTEHEMDVDADDI
jgi:Flp pilus assembly protein TadD